MHSALQTLSSFCRDHGICKSSKGTGRCGRFILGSGASASGSKTRMFPPLWPNDSLTHQGTSTTFDPEQHLLSQCVVMRVLESSHHLLLAEGSALV